MPLVRRGSLGPPIRRTSLGLRFDPGRGPLDFQTRQGGSRVVSVSRLTRMV